MRNPNLSTRQTARPVPTIRFFFVYAALMVLAILTGGVALYAASAATTAVPWDAGMAAMIGIFTGATARYLAALMFLGGAIVWGFSANDDGMRMIGKVILAGGLIIGALTLTEFLFGAVV